MGSSILDQRDNLVYSILELEADRFLDLRRDEQDLYFKNPVSGEFVLVAEAFDEKVGARHKDIIRKKRMRFFVSFVETLDMEDKLRPVALRVLRMMARHMTYGNVIRNMSIRDMANIMGTTDKYVPSGLRQLLDHDCIRYKMVKGRRVYMINPVLYFKGSHLGIFKAVREYKAMSKEGGKFDKF